MASSISSIFGPDPRPLRGPSDPCPLPRPAPGPVENSHWMGPRQNERRSGDGTPERTDAPWSTTAHHGASLSSTPTFSRTRVLHRNPLSKVVETPRQQARGVTCLRVIVAGPAADTPTKARPLRHRRVQGEGVSSDPRRAFRGASGWDKRDEPSAPSGYFITPLPRAQHDPGRCSEGHCFCAGDRLPGVYISRVPKN